eukprot:scaffold74801_cov75-Phaeocystis_antarctica.AAC.3
MANLHLVPPTHPLMRPLRVVSQVRVALAPLLKGRRVRMVREVFACTFRLVHKRHPMLAIHASDVLRVEVGPEQRDLLFGQVVAVEKHDPVYDRGNRLGHVRPKLRRVKYHLVVADRAPIHVAAHHLVCGVRPEKSVVARAAVFAPREDRARVGIEGAQQGHLVRRHDDAAVAEDSSQVRVDNGAGPPLARFIAPTIVTRRPWFVNLLCVVKTVDRKADLFEV